MKRCKLQRADFTSSMRTPARERINIDYARFNWSGPTSTIRVDNYHAVLMEVEYMRRPQLLDGLLFGAKPRKPYDVVSIIKRISRAILILKLIEGDTVKLDVLGACTSNPTLTYKVKVTVDEVRCACFNFIANESDPLSLLDGAIDGKDKHHVTSDDVHRYIAVSDALGDEVAAFDMEASIIKHKDSFTQMMKESLQPPTV